MTCVITGCALVDDDQGRAVWGDLHEIGGTWVFNAVLGPSGEAAWQYGDPIPEVTKQLVVSGVKGDAHILERRGVIVVRGDKGELNKAAERYLEGK